MHSTLLRPLRRMARVAVLLAACTPLAAAEPVELRLDGPMTAILHARHWDETRRQWDGPGNEELFFDAAHRFLMVRFPGCADALHARLASGLEIESATLLLAWADQEFRRVGDGYSWRGYRIKDTPPPRWHARVWALRRPWADDPERGPTWNAFMRGTGYWRRGGAQDTTYDRYAPALAEDELSEPHPEARLDVTRVFTDPRFGSTVSERLRSFEARGFLIDKAELYDRDIPILTGGIARLWTKPPVLLVKLRPAAADAELPPLPPATSLDAYAEELASSGTGGFPPSRLPDNWVSLAQSIWHKPEGVPDWMWVRTLEVRNLQPPTEYLLQTLEKSLRSGEEATYRSAVDTLLRMPLGWFQGHSHIDYLVPLLGFDAVLPEALRDHLRNYVRTRWEPPYAPDHVPFNVRYLTAMGTLNHQSQCRSEGILAAELLGHGKLAETARYGLSLMNRQMLFSDGTLQERGDSFYLGISWSCLQTAARHSSDPLTRLKASLGSERILLENAMTYHSGLRRRVSRVSRRYKLANLFMSQDAPRAALHTLSRKGVLIQTDQQQVHGIPVLGFGSVTPVRVALAAPWGRPWESNLIDEKTLPFTSVSTEYLRALIDDPIYNVSHLATNYAMASMSCDSGVEWPMMAVWRREASPVEALEDVGFLVAYGTVNGGHTSKPHDEEPKAAAVKRGPPTAMLQHNNKLIYMLRPPEKAFMDDVVQAGLTNLAVRLTLFAHGPREAREVWINDERVRAFPAAAGRGDCIAVRDGIVYLGLIALPGPRLDCSRDVVLRDDPPALTLDTFLLDAAAPLPAGPGTWQRLNDAAGGWIVELADATEYDSFDAFRLHLARTRLECRPDSETHVVHVAYASGDDSLELGFSLRPERLPVFDYVQPASLAAYQRVNGRWPWPDRSIDLDCPAAQMGTAPRLEKGGAVLESLEGQTALLRVEPVTGTYEAVNPFVEPQPLTLRTPGGVTVRSDGPIGCSRIVVQPSTGMLWVDYVLPPPTGDRAVERLQDDARKGLHAGWEGEQLISHYVRMDYDVRNARRDSARGIWVEGMAEPPTVVLNGRRLPATATAEMRNGRAWYWIPVAAR